MTPPILNGQVKTPLRAYPKAHMPFWAGRLCAEFSKDRPYPVVSFPNEIPPFQILTPTSSAMPSSWKVYRYSDDSEVADISSAVDMLLQELMAEGDYFIFFGGQVGATLEETELYWVLTFDDGQSWTSELFRPSFSGSDCQLIASGEEVFSTEFDDLIGWELGSTANEADEETAVAGAPADPSPFTGKKFVNTGDNKLYTYTGGVWVQSTPSPGDYRLVASTGVWYEFSGGAWVVMASPPFTLGDFGACHATNPDELGLFRSGLDTDATSTWYVRIDVGPFTLGYLTITLGAAIAQAVTHPGVTVLEFTGVGEDQEFSILPSTNFDGCIQSVHIYSGTLSPRCNNMLRWSACGDVGRTRYLSGFVNEFIFPSDTKEGSYDVLRPVIGLDIAASENGEGDRIANRSRKEVEWSMDFGRVPWHIADAISEAAVGGTLRLAHKRGLGEDVLLDVRVDQSWDGDEACYCNLVLYFKVDDASVASSCCDDMERACLEPCEEVAGFSDGELVEGGWYAIVDSRHVALMGPVELGHPVRCESGIIEVTGESIPRYFNALSGAWESIGMINSVTCSGDCDDGILVVTATVMAGMRGRLQYSVDGSTNWLNTDLDLAAEDWEANDIPVEVPAAFIRLQVYTSDCVMGSTDAQMLPCDEGSYQYLLSNNTTMADPGSGFFRVNSAVAASITQVAVSDTDFGGSDRQAYWDAAVGQLVISQPGSGVEELVLNITSVAGAASHHVLDVTYVSGDLDKSYPGCCLKYREA